MDTDSPQNWGQFTARNKTGGPASDEPAYIAHIADQIWSNVLSLAEEYGVGTIAYEYTDWHRNILSGKKSYSQRRKEYKIERSTQRTLGRAEVLMAMIGVKHGYKVIGFGANEVKSGLDVKSKSHAAMVAASAYQDIFKYKENKGKYLEVIATGEMLSHHISDAISIAMYAGNEIRLEEAMGA